ncbi:hypothetical protein [Pedosphaera parvula]|uniref:Transmembrane protein n=1 Tax=Pedosphaera parvula (strain Ellin514) TaxID=320771 RepID=B9XRP2_PEDPL|nr:hypothetical protein [Pedosphaera parvula]EEF57513.1 hypothetical protein Cflav_PD0444 [Pedosphaera parvula Ellin514]
MQETLKPSYVGKLFPPYSDEVTPLRPTSAGAKAGKIFYAVLGCALIGGIVWFIGLMFDWKWVRYAGIALGVWVLIDTIRNMLKSQCAACPYCRRDVGSKSLLQLSVDDKNKQFACEGCFEWLISDGGQIRAFRETDIGNTKEFDCPVIANGVWPNECIVCGAPTTRHLNAKTLNVGLASLLVGRLSVSYGSVKNIPYCDVHEAAVTVKTVDRKIWADFKDYAARRRYLHANRIHRMEAAKQIS